MYLMLYFSLGQKHLTGSSLTQEECILAYRFMTEEIRHWGSNHSNKDCGCGLLPPHWSGNQADYSPLAHSYNPMSAYRGFCSKVSQLPKTAPHAGTCMSLLETFHIQITTSRMWNLMIRPWCNLHLIYLMSLILTSAKPGTSQTGWTHLCLHHLISPFVLIQTPGSTVLAATQDHASVNKSLVAYNVYPVLPASFPMLSGP